MTSFLAMLVVISASVGCSNQFSVVKVEFCGHHKNEFMRQEHYLVSGDRESFQNSIDSIVISSVCLMQKGGDSFNERYLFRFYKKTKSTTYEELQCRAKPYLHDVNSDLISTYRVDKKFQGVIKVFNKGHGYPPHSNRELPFNCLSL